MQTTAAQAFLELRETGRADLGNGATVTLKTRQLSLGDDIPLAHPHDLWHPAAVRSAKAIGTVPVAVITFNGTRSNATILEHRIIFMAMRWMRKGLEPAQAGGNAGRAEDAAPVGLRIEFGSHRALQKSLSPVAANLRFEKFRRMAALLGHACWYHLDRKNQATGNWVMFFAHDLVAGLVRLEATGRSPINSHHMVTRTTYVRLASHEGHGQGMVVTGDEGARPGDLSRYIAYFGPPHDAAILHNANHGFGRSGKMDEWYPGAAGVIGLQVDEKLGRIAVSPSSHLTVGIQGNLATQTSYTKVGGTYEPELVVPRNINRRTLGWQYHLLDYVFASAAANPKLPKKVAIPTMYFPENQKEGYMPLDLGKVRSIAEKHGFSFSEDTAKAMASRGWREELGHVSFVKR